MVKQQLAVALHPGLPQRITLAARREACAGIIRHDARVADRLRAVQLDDVRRAQLRAGVNNVLDRDPPVIPAEITGTGSGNVYPNYDTLGREVFVGFTVRL